MVSNSVPIADHAAIGDCRSVALVSRDGTIDWLCWPNFASPALFAGLLDPDGGHFRVTPVRPGQARRRYLAETNVLETIFENDDGQCRVTDFMPIPPGDDAIRPARELVRLVEGLGGSMDIAVDFAPRPDFGRKPVRLHRNGMLGWSVAWHGEAVWLHEQVGLRASSDGRALTGQFRLKAGDFRVLWLTYSAGEMGVFPPMGEARSRLEDTVGFWRSWIGRCTHAGSHAKAVRRSLLALKLLTYAPSGAVVAAATTSLPEAVGADRNWDYRYCWLRDSSLTFRVFNDAGYPREADRFLSWLILATRLTAPRLQVVYDVYGRAAPSETVLERFAGWRNSRPVRVGNDAHRQFQLDLYGEAMATAADFVQHGGRLTPLESRLLDGWATSVGEMWRLPDRGIWEVRTPDRHFTFSKAMAWTAFDALIRLIEHRQVEGGLDRLERLRTARDEVAREIESQGVAPDGGYVAAFGEDFVDASLLLLPWFGYVPANAPRMRATCARILSELGHGPLIKRYRTGFDGFDSEEGAFTACGFWAADCLARAGALEEAEDRFGRLLGFANDLGLFAEEINVETGTQLGNFPQAFSHIALVNAAMTMDEEHRKRGQ